LLTVGLVVGIAGLLFRPAKPVMTAMGTPTKLAEDASRPSTTDRSSDAVASLQEDAAGSRRAPEPDPTCARFAEATSASLATIRGELPSSDWEPPRLCATSVLGTWALVVDGAIVGSPEGLEEDGVGFALLLVHVDAHGRKTSVLPMKSFHEHWKAHDAAALTVNLTLRPAWGAIEIHVLTAYDYDGDGEAEVVLSASAADEGPDRHATEAWTFRDGAIVPFRPLAEIEIQDVKDVDGDGRPDILFAGRYAGVEAASALGSSYRVAPALFLVHALAGGGFSETDGVARAHARAKCPSKTPLALDGSGYFTEEDAQSIVCAKLWGAGPREVAAAWNAVCPEADASDDTKCQDWPKKLGAITPPFVLTP
jgi:hypothetical protein